MQELKREDCVNVEAFDMMTTDPGTFNRLARQCADVSCADVILYDTATDTAMSPPQDGPLSERARLRPLAFHPLDDRLFEEIKTQALNYYSDERWREAEVAAGMDPASEQGSLQDLAAHVRSSLSAGLNWFMNQTL